MGSSSGLGGAADRRPPAPYPASLPPISSCTQVRVWVLVLFRIPLPLPAAIPLAFWIGQQFFMFLADPAGGVSWSAHVGGIVAGLLLVVRFATSRCAAVRSTIVTPRAVEHRTRAPDETLPAAAGLRSPLAMGPAGLIFEGSPRIKVGFQGLHALSWGHAR